MVVLIAKVVVAVSILGIAVVVARKYYSHSTPHNAGADGTISRGRFERSRFGIGTIRHAAYSLARYVGSGVSVVTREASRLLQIPGRGARGKALFQSARHLCARQLGALRSRLAPSKGPQFTEHPIAEPEEEIPRQSRQEGQSGNMAIKSKRSALARKTSKVAARVLPYARALGLKLQHGTESALRQAKPKILKTGRFLGSRSQEAFHAGLSLVRKGGHALQECVQTGLDKVEHVRMRQKEHAERMRKKQEFLGKLMKNVENDRNNGKEKESPEVALASVPKKVSEPKPAKLKAPKVGNLRESVAGTLEKRGARPMPVQEKSSAPESESRPPLAREPKAAPGVSVRIEHEWGEKSYARKPLRPRGESDKAPWWSIIIPKARKRGSTRGEESARHIPVTIKSLPADDRVNRERAAAILRHQERKLLQQIVEHPRDIALYKRLGYVYLELDQPNDAKDCFAQAIKLGSQDPLVRRELQRLMVMRGLTD